MSFFNILHFSNNRVKMCWNVMMYDKNYVYHKKKKKNNYADNIEKGILLTVLCEIIW